MYHIVTHRVRVGLAKVDAKLHDKVVREKNKLISNRDIVGANIVATDRNTEKVSDVVFDWLTETDILIKEMENLTIQSKATSWNEFKYELMVKEKARKVKKKAKALSKKCRQFHPFSSTIDPCLKDLFRWHIFLSFRGKDTRQSLTGFLYDALRRKGFKTFMDDEGLKGGDEISSSLVKAIEESRIAIVVLSENFADSPWCLDELVTILKCKKMKNQKVLPIFYKIEPSVVRHQTNSYKKAMAKHKKKYRNDSEKVKEWMSALSEVANLKGIASNCRYVVYSLAKWHIFLSFRGKDTRYSFTGFLYDALCRKGFKTFMDDEELKGGEEISSSLVKAIEASRIAIVVLSENFADSPWCLDELVTILKCKKMKNQKVLPIFYKIEPSVVRHQTNSYKKAMAKHKKKYRNDSEKVKEWMSALSEVANLKGIASNCRYVVYSLAKWHIFLSFRGKDTRYSFTGFLYDALCRKGFKTFMDDEELKGGEEISSSLVKAIEASRIAIVVLSENFADSPWCLDELVTILKCKKMKNQKVLPIFYKIEPSVVRHQTNSYKKAMAKHKKKYRNDSEKVKEWMSALSEVANLKGIASNCRYVVYSLAKWHIFLSFRGKDTRYSFTGFLYDALCRKGFKTFMDDEELKGGEEISSSLVKAIEASRIAIVVLSENFADSPWCLDELVTILKCKKMKNQKVLPIFYKIEPSVVRHQTNSYKKAMAKHKKKYGNDSERVKEWMSALSEIANLKGLASNNYSSERKLIEEIVEMANDIENK